MTVAEALKALGMDLYRDRSQGDPRSPLNGGEEGAIDQVLSSIDPTYWTRTDGLGAQNNGTEGKLLLANRYAQSPAGVTSAAAMTPSPGTSDHERDQAARAGGGVSGGGWFAENAPGGGQAFGAEPAPFGETYIPLARPSYLQGEYVPGQWDETFAAPDKPSVLQTPYALPTQAELEASAGYLSGASAMQRGMERSAAAKGSVLSGGFVGRTLPRALGEYAGSAYGNLVNQTLGARQQQYGEYSGDVSNAFAQYQQRYGQFADAEGLKLGARNVNESAFQGDQATNLTGYNTRYAKYLDAAGLKRQAENDVWNRNMGLSDLSLRAAALARP